jgi:hypothetical protein
VLYQTIPQRRRKVKGPIIMIDCLELLEEGVHERRGEEEHALLLIFLSVVS